MFPSLVIRNIILIHCPFKKITSWWIVLLYFGIPSQDDVDALAHANRVLGRTVDGVVRKQNRVIAKVNKLGQIQAKLSKV